MSNFKVPPTRPILKLILFINTYSMALPVLNNLSRNRDLKKNKIIIHSIIVCCLLAQILTNNIIILYI